MSFVHQVYRRHASGFRASSATAIDIAEDCREAALALVNGVPLGWTKADLAAWLRGPYSNATRFKNPSMPPPDPNADSETHPNRTLDPEEVDRLLFTARLGVMAALEDAALPKGRLAFVQRMIAGHYVMPVALGLARGWVPVDAPRLRLRTRVLSLFAADILTRPADYATQFLVCHRCEAVVFDRRAVDRGFCSQHTEASYAR